MKQFVLDFQKKNASGKRKHNIPDKKGRGIRNMAVFTFWQFWTVISVAWIGIRAYFDIKDHKVDWLRELKLLTVYICIVVIMRIVYFPWHLENGKIGTLVFDAGQILPFRLNLIPVVHLFDIYEGWQRNLFGNIAMFIPVGLAWPFCFKKLDSVGKVVLAGFCYSLMIELSQLLFYDRGTDVDDLITNTSGVLIGALIYFGISRIICKK